MKTPDKSIRERSGSVNSKDPLVTFLYILMRDELTPGRIEEIIKEHVQPEKRESSQFSNGWLATYARDIAARLRR